MPAAECARSRSINSTIVACICSILLSLVLIIPECFFYLSVLSSRNRNAHAVVKIDRVGRYVLHVAQIDNIRTSDAAESAIGCEYAEQLGNGKPDLDLLTAENVDVLIVIVCLGVHDMARVDALYSVLGFELDQALAKLLGTRKGHVHGFVKLRGVDRLYEVAERSHFVALRCVCNRGRGENDGAFNAKLADVTCKRRAHFVTDVNVEYEDVEGSSVLQSAKQ